jgi:hypothetical protein
MSNFNSPVHPTHFILEFIVCMEGVAGDRNRSEAEMAGGKLRRFHRVFWVGLSRDQLTEQRTGNPFQLIFNLCNLSNLWFQMRILGLFEFFGIVRFTRSHSTPVASILPP